MLWIKNLSKVLNLIYGKNIAYGENHPMMARDAIGPQSMAYEVDCYFIRVCNVIFIITDILKDVKKCCSCSGACFEWIGD